MLTIAYVRVSTDDQVEHSPEAQRRRCAEYAQSKGLDVPRFLSDEGMSGKNLDRPAMQELIALIEADQVANLIVWRIDRLSRDSGDVNRLLKLFEKHCVSVHSLERRQRGVDHRLRDDSPPVCTGCWRSWSERRSSRTSRRACTN